MVQCSVQLHSQVLTKPCQLNIGDHCKSYAALSGHLEWLHAFWSYSFEAQPGGKQLAGCTLAVYRTCSCLKRDLRAGRQEACSENHAVELISAELPLRTCRCWHTA